MIAVLFLIVGIVAMGKNSDSNPHEYKKGRTQAMWAGISLGGTGRACRDRRRDSRARELIDDER